MHAIHCALRSSLQATAAALLAAATIGAASSAAAAGDRGDQGMYCSSTAQTLARACQYEATDDYYKASAICINFDDADERAPCNQDARDARNEALQRCDEELSARRQVCAQVGERRYDPDFDEIAHETDFGSPTSNNRYFPLRIGNRWELRGGTEVIRIEVLNQTKLIDGVRCVVVRDVVTVDGAVREATDDWIAQGRDGTVWYCGEEVKDYETFAGDQPLQPELISRDGSFKAGRDGDKAGVLFLAAPRVGVVYREEFSVGNAEDVSQVIATNYSYGRDPGGLDRLVPATLAQLLCANDCVVLKAYTAMEPGDFALKYYAPGIGNFLEVKPESGETVQLVSCNVDARCGSLPQL